MGLKMLYLGLLFQLSDNGHPKHESILKSSQKQDNMLLLMSYKWILFKKNQVTITHDL